MPDSLHRLQLITRQIHSMQVRHKRSSKPHEGAQLERACISSSGKGSILQDGGNNDRQESGLSLLSSSMGGRQHCMGNRGSRIIAGEGELRHEHAQEEDVCIVAHSACNTAHAELHQ